MLGKGIFVVECLPEEAQVLGFQPLRVKQEGRKAERYETKAKREGGRNAGQAPIRRMGMLWLGRPEVRYL